MSTEITNGQVNGDLELEAERNNGKRPRFFKSLLKEKNSKNGSTRASKKSESNNVGQNSAEDINYDDEFDSRTIRGGRSSAGMMLEVGELFREDEDSPWDEWIPDDVVGGTAIFPEFQPYALILRREKKNSKSGLVLHSIIVQSPLLRKVLDTLFSGYDGISTKLRELKFYAPFHEFYYRWHRFEQLYQQERDKETEQHLALFYPIISKEILPHIRTMEDLTYNGVISFEYLWAIFPPGMDIYSKVDGQDRLYKLKQCRYGKTMANVPSFNISCRYIDCDGTSFGYRSTSMTIDYFDDIKKIIDLNVLPSHLHPDAESLLDKLHSRGEKFEKLNGFNHLAYSGFYIDQSPGKLPRKRHTHESRIIVDPKMFSFYTHDTGRPMDPIYGGGFAAEHGEEHLMCPVANLVHRATTRIFSELEDQMGRYEKGDLAENSHSLTTKQRVLCTPMVRGFCLSSKRWAEFFVENIQPIKWSEDAFKRLHLPNDNKDIIHAFVEEQLSEQDSYDDIVQGKGRGFIMLLSGEPGVGKTLTAESVAEEMRKPLYCISAGELGELASAVEESLETILELSAKWGAILLLDECDIFLEQRTRVDIQRNRLVSIFLRQLEYYRGVMFLTTNRVSTIDAAFESRIHLSIDYPALDLQSRLHIWRTFTTLQGSSTQYSSNLSEKDLEILAEIKMNGRQIKNVVKTARLFAKQKKVPLALDHIEMVLKLKKKESVFVAQEIDGPDVNLGITSN